MDASTGSTSTATGRAAGGWSGGASSCGTGVTRYPRRRVWRGSATAFRRSVASSPTRSRPGGAVEAADRKIDVMRRYWIGARARAFAGGRDRGGAGVPEGVLARRRDTDPASRRSSPSTRRTGGSPSTTSICGTTTSVRRSSRSAPTSRIRSRCGSTGTSGPNVKPPKPGSGSPSCPTGSPPATTRPRCRPSVTGSVRAPSRCSSSAGCHRLPLPLTAADRDAGYWWELSHARRSRPPAPSCFDAPRHARGFFEALVADNLDIGRPDHDRDDLRRQIRGGGRATEAATFKTTRGHPRHRGHRQRLLQALPHQAVPQRRPRPADRDRDQHPRRPGLQRRLHNLDELQAKARDVNRRLLRC